MVVSEPRPVLGYLHLYRREVEAEVVPVRK